MPEHDDRGAVGGGCRGADSGEKGVGHVGDRLARRRVLLEDRRAGAIGRGDRGDLLGIEAAGRVEESDHVAVGGQHGNLRGRGAAGIDVVGEPGEGRHAGVRRQHRQAVGVGECELVKGGLDLSPVLRFGRPSGEHERRNLLLELGEVRGNGSGRRGLGCLRDRRQRQPDADHEADGRPRAATKRDGMSHGASTGLGGAAMWR